MSRRSKSRASSNLSDAVSLQRRSACRLKQRCVVRDGACDFVTDREAKMPVKGFLVLSGFRLNTEAKSADPLT